MTDTTQAAERLRFEAWISGPPFERCVAQFSDRPEGAWPGQYTDPSVQLCWLAWQEALTHADEPQP